MKKPSSLLIMLICSIAVNTTPSLMAGPSTEKGNDHSHEKASNHAGHSHDKKEAGPNGGRIIHTVEPHFEVFVRDDRRIQITFLDDKNKPIAPAKQEITAVTGDRSKPTNLTFSVQEKVLLSDQSLPEGNKMPFIITIKNTPESRAIRERFTMDLSECGGCDYKEYACTCGH